MALLLIPLAACAAPPSVPLTGGEPPRLLAVESFLADIAANVAGPDVQIDTLIPRGVDPHTFEPTPGDVLRVAQAQALLVNGAGFESFLGDLLTTAQADAGGRLLVIEASHGLTARPPDHLAGEVEHGHAEGDPHFWLDPTLTKQYVENIRAGLTTLDPTHAAAFQQRADAYLAQLDDLDRWIQAQVDTIPAERRLLVTNHESLGYFADRYGFQIVGAIIPSTAGNAETSAQGLAALVEAVRAVQAPAIFLETGSNPRLAEQVAAETGRPVVSQLYTHSLSAPDGPAATYLAMMRYNTDAIVRALR
jgi:ABC-type Zn uptake system ZnuABC Zn-binding protein ZnuA